MYYTRRKSVRDMVAGAGRRIGGHMRYTNVKAMRCMGNRALHCMERRSVRCMDVEAMRCMG